MGETLLTIAGFLGIITTLYSLYYVIIGTNYKKEIAEYPDTSKNNKFAILIAARNEELVITDLIESLKNQNYPKDKYDIFVMPNNCTDKTKEVAEKVGARIFEPTKPVKSKGEVLNQTFPYLLENEDHDAFVIFDADNVVDENYLREMNKVIESGYPVAIGFRDSKNPTATYMSSAYSIFYLMFNTLYNRARAALGMNSLITGTGFMFTREKIKEIGGWNTSTLTEDIEFTLILSNNGDKIAYVPKAITYDEQPEDFVQAWHQRLRWSVGSQQGFRLMSKSLLIKALKREGQNTGDMFIMLLATYMQIFGFVTGVIGLIGFFLLGFKEFMIAFVITTILLIVVQATLGIITLRFLDKPIRPMLKGVFTLWFFTLSWVPIHVLAMFKNKLEWKAIKHKGNNV